MKTKKIVSLAAIMILWSLITGFQSNLLLSRIIVMASLFAFVVKLGLALWILRLNPSGKVNKFFAIVFIGQAGWDLGKYLLWITTDEHLGMALIWAKISYSAYIISVFFLFNFIWAYLKSKNFFTRFWGQVIVFTPMVFMLISLWFSTTVITGLVHPEIHTHALGVELWSYDYGPIYDYFFIWFQMFPFMYAFVMFIYKYFKSETADKKKQRMYLLIGSAFPILIGIPTGVILPAFGITLPPHNNILSLIMSLFIAIGIIKYKFLAVQPIEERIIPGRKIDRALENKYPLQSGHIHFINNDKSVDISYTLLLSRLYKKEYGLIITAHNPSTIRHDYGIETTPIIWMTDTDTEHLSIDPINIEQLFQTVNEFIKKVPNSCIVIDGLDYLLVHNNFAKIRHFIKELNSTIAKSKASLIIPKGILDLEDKKEVLLYEHLDVLPAKTKKVDMTSQKIADFKGKKNFVIIGHNPLSQSIISEFEKRCMVSTVIEKKEILIKYPKKAVKIIRGDPLSKKVLESAGITKPNTLVLITLEDDSEIMLCINKIRQLSATTQIITNLHNEKFTPIAIKAGANKVIPSAAIGGRLIALALKSPDIVRWLMDATTLSAKELELVELKSNKMMFSGKSIQTIDNLLGSTGNVIAVKNDYGLMMIPDDNYVLKTGDGVVLVADLHNVPKGKTLIQTIKSLLGHCKAKKTAKKVKTQKQK